MTDRLTKYITNNTKTKEKIKNKNKTKEKIIEKTKTRKKREFTEVDPMRETGFGIKKLLETMSSQEENESYMTEFTRDKLREMLKTGEKLPTSFSEKKLSPIMEDTFSKPFKNMIGDIKTKSLQSTKNIFQTLLQEKFNSQRFIKVKFSDKLKKISHNTHELYKKLGIKDKIPDDMPLDCIESIRLIDPKFLLFFLETGTATNSSQPSFY